VRVIAALAVEDSIAIPWRGSPGESIASEPVDVRDPNWEPIVMVHQIWSTIGSIARADSEYPKRGTAYRRALFSVGRHLIFPTRIYRGFFMRTIKKDLDARFPVFKRADQFIAQQPCVVG